jgi:hypothetical protein
MSMLRSAMPPPAAQAWGRESKVAHNVMRGRRDFILGIIRWIVGRLLAIAPVECANEHLGVQGRGLPGGDWDEAPWIILAICHAKWQVVEYGSNHYNG